MRAVRLVRFSMAIVSVLSGASWSVAQEVAESSARSGGIEEVVIQARRRAENVQDTPLSVSAVGGEKLEVERLDRVNEYAAKLPNFTSVQQNTRVSSLLVRGLGGNASSDGSEAGVGLIVDDVFYTHVGFSWLDFVDLDHIELVRGPQGTLLGKNTTIGALLVTTKPPSFEPEGTFSATIANQGRYQLRTNLSGPLIGESLAGRITLYGDTSDGWIENEVDGERYLDTNRYGVRGQLLYNSEGGVSNRTIFERYQTSEYNNFYPPSGDVTTFRDGTPRANAWSARLKERFGYTPDFDAPNNANLDTQERIRSNVWGVSNRLDWEVGEHTLTSVTAWRQLYFRPRNDTDATPFAIFRSGYDVDVAQYSQEVRLASPAGQAVDYQLGVYALREDVRSELRTFFFDDASTFFIASGASPAILDGVEVDQLGRTRVSSYAAFGQATWNLSDRAALTAGLRYTHEIRSASNEGDSRGGALVTGDDATRRAGIVNGFGGVFDVGDRRDTGSVAWLINPSYQFSDDLLGYISISQGEKSGAANLGATPGKPVIIGPEKSTAYEIGLKSSWLDRRVTLNGNLYWNDIDDYQANESDRARLSVGSFLGNVGKVRLRGFELDGAVQVTDRLGVGFSGAFNDAKYRSYEDAPAPPEFMFPGAPRVVDLSGKQIPNAPRWSGQVSLSYERPLNGSFDLFLYASERVRSATHLSSPVSSDGRQSGYGVANAGIGIRRSDGKYSVQLWIKNAFDEDYAVLYGAAGGSTPLIKVVGEPRTFGVSITLSTF
jgi:iron complex outermembrane recepter protein